MRKKVFIILETSGQPGRAQLIGILRGINAMHLDWDMDIAPSRKKVSAVMVRRALDRNMDGFILAHPVRPGIPELLQRQRRPTVFMDILSPTEMPSVSTSLHLRVDDAAIGCTAAKHFLALGNFRSFAFIHDSRNEVWTHERQIAFAATLEASKRECKTFTPNAKITTEQSQAALVSFIHALPLPVAVFGANDLVAETVLQACKTAKLSIPEDVAVMGVDNDISICNRLRPRLSSIEPDFEEEGFRAAIALERLFGNKIETDEKPIAAVRLVERETTKPLPPATRLVERALAFIEDNYRTPITVCDVARHLGVSRRLIDLRFRQLQHETILATITRRRLDALCKTLKDESGPLREIVASCGFGSTIRASHLFKARYGMSMSDYRSRRNPPSIGRK